MNEIEKDLHELKFNNIEKLEIMINNIEIRINEIEIRINEIEKSKS